MMVKFMSGLMDDESSDLRLMERFKKLILQVVY